MREIHPADLPLKREILQLVMRLGCRIFVNDSLRHPACVYVNKGAGGRAVVDIHLRTTDLGDEEVSTLFLHELSHIIRGDILVRGVDPAVWNMAADILINEGLDHEVVRRLQGMPPWSEFAKKRGMPQYPIPSTQKLYNLLLQEQPAAVGVGVGVGSVGDGGEGGGSGGDDNAEPNDGAGGADTNGADAGADANVGSGPIVVDKDLSRGELEILVATAIVEARGVGVGVETPSISIGKNIPTQRRTPPAPEPVQLSLSRKLEQVLARHFGRMRQHHRTWMRPGRAEHLRGATRRPRTSILVGLDVSGSTSGIIGEMVYAAGMLRRRHDVDVVYWDIDVHKGMDTVGGGTQVQCLWRYAEKHRRRYDVVIAVTDGHVNDWEPLPRLPVIVVVPPGAPETPDGAVRVEYKRRKST